MEEYSVVDSLTHISSLGESIHDWRAMNSEDLTVVLSDILNLLRNRGCYLEVNTEGSRPEWGICNHNHERLPMTSDIGVCVLPP